MIPSEVKDVQSLSSGVSERDKSLLAQKLKCGNYK
jgi:hypothetical protein